MGLSRVLFAQRAEFDSSVLANVEHCKIAVRYGLAKRLIRNLSINPDWLARGESPVIRRLPDTFNLDTFGDDTDLFSQAYDSGVGNALLESEESIMRECDRVRGSFLVERGDPMHISKIASAEKDRLLCALSAELNRRWLSETQNSALPRAAESTELKTFDVGSCDDTTAPMPSSLLEQLIAKAKAATAGRGQRAELARSLGVPRQRVAQWFSGVSAPNSEDTLRLHEWVAASEAKQTKSAGRGETRPARATRKDQSKANEKAKSTRRKKR